MKLPFPLSLLSPRPVFSEEIRVQSERLLLRPLLVSDAEAMFIYASDPLVTRYLPWEPAPNIESVRPFLADQVGKRKRGDSLGFALLLHTTGQMIGSTDLMELRGALRGQAELGYLLDRAYWGQGLMTEAARTTVAYGFNTLGLKRIIAFADSENLASRRVLEKIGMRICGTEERMVKGESRCYVRYAVERAGLLPETKKS